MTNKALFCKNCSLQFDKKIVYDIHLSFVHNINIKVKSEEKTIEIKEKQNIVNSNPKGNNSHKCNKKQHVEHIKSVHEGKKPHNAQHMTSGFH